MRWYFLLFCLFVFGTVSAQNAFDVHFNALKQLKLDSGVTLTFDEPLAIKSYQPTKVIIFALPNGNTTAQTFGKKLAQGDDWHFDIQHIGAQTEFIRTQDQKTNYIVVYAENTLKSWPAWRKKANSDDRIALIVKTVLDKYTQYDPKITLSGHSGGGSFIFGFLNSQNQIPTYVDRIGFLDATYGYETEKHNEKLKHWLTNKKNALQIIAYNDSVVIYNDKPLVSPTGGTWYRSKLMANDLLHHFNLHKTEIDDRFTMSDARHRIEVKLIKNPEAKIYHTVLVEKNGFIDLIFNGTKFDSKNYTFWGDRAYQSYVLQ
jgi:hypothetical protein